MNLTTLNRLLAGVIVTACVLGGCGFTDTDDDTPEAARYTQVHPSGNGADNPARGPEPTTAPADDREVEPDVFADPIQVMELAAAELFTWYPATEANRGAATVRSGDFLVEELVHDTPDLRPGPEWTQWADEGAEILATARVLDDQHPPDTDNSVSRVLEVQQIKHVDDREDELDSRVTVWMTATLVDDIWQVTDYQLM